MMSESNKPLNVFSTPTSSSRLSPSARPFTVSNSFNRHESFELSLDSSSSSSLSNSNLDQTFPYLSLGGQGHHGYCTYHSDATSITAFPCVDDLDFEPYTRFPYYPLEESPLHTHFALPSHQSSPTVVIPSSSSLGKVGCKSGVQGTVTNQQGREIPRKHYHTGSAGSLSCSNLLEQGTTVEGSKLVSETSSFLHGKGSVVIGKDNQIRPEDMEKIHTESSIFQMASSEVNLLNGCMTKPLSVSLDLPYSPIPQDTQSQMSYSAPLMTSSHCDSTIITNERCFPQFGSFGAETLVSCAPECLSSAQVFNQSSSSSNPPIVKPDALENVSSCGTDAVSKRDTYFGYVLPSMLDTGKVQSPVDKVSDETIKEQGERRKIVELVHNETKNPSVISKPKLQIACPKVPKDLTLEQHGAGAGIPDDRSSTNHDDSDVDSPCWRGTMAYKSPLRDSATINSEDSKGQSRAARVSVPLKSGQSKSEKAARNSLNPLAPVFIPRKSKQKVDYHQKECHGDSSLSSQKTAALAVISSSKEHILIDSVKAGTCPTERISDIVIKENGVPYKSFKSSDVNTLSFQPNLREEHVTSESQLLRGTNFTGSVEGIIDATHNGLDSVVVIAHNVPNTSISLLTTEIALNSHSIGVGLFSDFTERLKEPSKSTPPKIDVKSMINTIQYLSELLLQNSSFDLSSLSEHEHDKLLNIINNLYVIRNKAGQMALRPASSDPCTSYGEGQTADYHEVTKLKGKAVLHDQEMHKTSAPMLSNRMLYSFYQSNDEGFRKGNDISQIQVIGKDPKVTHSI